MVAVDLIRLRKNVEEFWRVSIVPELEGFLDEEDLEQVNGKSVRDVFLPS
jgi:hypothetical protein